MQPSVRVAEPAPKAEAQQRPELQREGREQATGGGESAEAPPATATHSGGESPSSQGLPPLEPSSESRLTRNCGGVRTQKRES